MILSTIIFLSYCLKSRSQVVRVADASGNSYEINYGNPQNSTLLTIEIQSVCESLQFFGCERLLRCELMHGDLPECRETYDHSMPDQLIVNELTGEISLQHRFKHRFSSVSCQGGTQLINGSLLRSSNHRHRFRPHDGEFKVCKFHNVCLLYGDYPTLVYFIDPDNEGLLPKDHQFRYLDLFQQLELGYVSDYDTRQKNRSWIPVTYIEDAMPDNLVVHSARLIPFLLESSFANHGHHLMDTVFPVFAAALQYEIPLSNAMQLFVHSCSRMAGATATEMSVLLKNVTNQQHCLALINKRWQFFFDQAPRFLDVSSLQGKKTCFRTLIAGMGSAFSQKAWDISRGPALRSFRDHVVRRTLSTSQLELAKRKWKTQVLVLLMGNTLNLPENNNANYKETVNNNLCSWTKSASQEIKKELDVVCYRPESNHVDDLADSFAAEVELAQSSRLIITYHGTLAYTALFAQEFTKVIAITEETPNNFAKDYHLFSRALHFSMHYLTLNLLQKDSTVLQKLLRHLLQLQETELEAVDELERET